MLQIEVCPNCHYKSLYVRKDGSKICYKCGYEVDEKGNVLFRGNRNVRKRAGTEKILNYQLCPKCGFHKLYIGVKKVHCYECGFEMEREKFDKYRDKLLNKTVLMAYLSECFTSKELLNRVKYLEKMGYLKIVDRFHNKYGLTITIKNKLYKYKIIFTEGKVEFVKE